MQDIRFYLCSAAPDEILTVGFRLCLASRGLLSRHTLIAVAVPRETEQGMGDGPGATRRLAYAREPATCVHMCSIGILYGATRGRRTARTKPEHVGEGGGIRCGMWVPIIFRLRLVIGGGSPRADLRAARKEREASRKRLRESGRQRNDLEAIARLIGMPDRMPRSPIAAITPAAPSSPSPDLPPPLPAPPPSEEAMENAIRCRTCHPDCGVRPSP